MRLCLALAVLAVLTVGCRNPDSPAADPFSPRTRVPPPGTGAVGPAPGTPYYQVAPGSAAPLGGAPPITPGTSLPAPATSIPPAYTPPGAYRGASIQSVNPAGSTAEKTVASAQNTGASPLPAVSLAGRDRVIRILQPRPTSAPVIASTSSDPVPVSPAGNSAAPASGRSSTSGVPVDIMDLPKPHAASSPANTQTPANRGTVQLATYHEPDAPLAETAVGSPSSGSSDTSGESTQGSVSSRGHYGYDTNYQWLRGRLECSQVDQQWKLRYIPLDGETDQYGGSVIVSDPKILSGYERGEYIEVRGRVQQADPKKGFAPKYEVSAIQRLSSAAR